MKRCFLLLFLPVVLFMLGACSEKEEPNPEYANWAARNDVPSPTVCALRATPSPKRALSGAMLGSNTAIGACCAIISSVPTQKPTVAIR